MNSYWLSSTKKIEIEKQIDNNYVVDVCIVGAGITGLSTAYYLAKNGLKVIVVDKSEIGEKTSGHTTAKITLQHGLIYNYLINTFGIDLFSKLINFCQYTQFWFIYASIFKFALNFWKFILIILI